MEGNKSSEKGKERERGKECSRHVDSDHFWIALYGGSQRFNWIKLVATRDAPCTGSARTIRARCSSKGAVEEARRRRRQERKEIALWKILARLKPEFNTVHLMVTIPNRRERAHWTDEFLFTVTSKDCTTHNAFPCRFLEAFKTFKKKKLEYTTTLRRLDIFLLFGPTSARLIIELRFIRTDTM